MHSLTPITNNVKYVIMLTLFIACKTPVETIDEYCKPQEKRTIQTQLINIHSCDEEGEIVFMIDSLTRVIVPVRVNCFESKIKGL